MSYRQPVRIAMAGGLGKGGGGGHGGGGGGHGGGHQGGGGHHGGGGHRGGGGRMRGGRRGWGWPGIWGWGPGYYGYGYYVDNAPTCEDRCGDAATPGAYRRCMDWCATNMWL